MFHANAVCWVPQSKVDKQAYCQQVENKVTANVVLVKFSELKKLSQNIQQGQPIFCQSCQAVLNHLSEIKENVWKCEFCSYSNQLKDQFPVVPVSTDVFYLLKDPKFKDDNQSEQEVKNNQKIEETKSNVDYEDTRTILFCLDNSGSMIRGSLIADKEGNKKYVSRKKCVENALEAQILQMKLSTPNRKVGLVLFSTQISVLGDCQSAAKQTFEADGSFEKFYELGQINFNSFMKLKISDNDSLLSAYRDNKTNGTTSLGPALAFSLGLCSQSNESSGSTIIVCTDGMANNGIGNLEGDKIDEDSYVKMGQLARAEGIQINVITMKETESGVKVLGGLAAETGGKSSRVGPSDFNDGFSDFLKGDVVATRVEVVMQLHEGLKLIEGNPHEALGTVSESSSLTFQYAVKTDYDFGNLSSVPLQAKIFFTCLNGSQMVRVITNKKQLTLKQEKAHENVQIEILANHANKTNAKYAQQISASEAEQQSDQWDKFIKKDILVRNKSQEKEVEKFDEKRQKLAKALQIKKDSKSTKLMFDSADQDIYDLY